MLVGALAASLLEFLNLQQESVLLYLNDTTEATEKEKKKLKHVYKKKKTQCLGISLIHFILTRQLIAELLAQLVLALRFVSYSLESLMYLFFYFFLKIFKEI